MCLKVKENGGRAGVRYYEEENIGCWVEKKRRWDENSEKKRMDVSTKKLLR